MIERAREIALAIRGEKEMTIVGHADADGIAATAILAKALDREGICYEVRIVKQLDEDLIAELKEEGRFVAFLDLGSGMVDELDFRRAIMDHHIPGGFGQKLHLNPHLFGFDGSTDISGAGTAYMVAKALSPSNVDLSALAIVGAVGDMQTKTSRRLISLNRKILDDAIGAGKISSMGDIELFGRESRPIYKMLEYASDPIIPGITSNEAAAMSLLNATGIELRSGDRLRRWVDLSFDEKRSVVSSLVKYLVKRGYGKRARRLVGEVYIMSEEEEGTELHDAKEFSTLLNSTARYDMGEVGLEVAKGDRGDFLSRARSLLSGHRLQLAMGLDVLKEIGITRRGRVNQVHAGDAVRDTLLGTLLNMLLTSGEVDTNRPLVGFAKSDGGKIKVSSRGTEELVKRGLDLGKAMAEAALSVGGIGGGHDIAAGATIKEGDEGEFLGLVEEIVGRQYGGAD
jgi:RecJ-like exonuclease